MKRSVMGILAMVALVPVSNGCSSSSAESARIITPVESEGIEGLEVLGLKSFPDGNFLLWAWDDNVGTELFLSDGTDAGTQLIVDLYPGDVSGAGDYVSPYFNGGFYFVGITPASGEDLWFTDGTAAGTVLVAELSTSPGSDITVRNVSEEPSRLIFIINEHPVGGEVRSQFITFEE